MQSLPKPPRNRSMSLKDARRFRKLIDVRSDDECWPWLGGKDGPGYGRFTYNGRTEGAHRIAWEMDHHVQIPEGMLICHHCDNPPCVNPAHLFLGTVSDNARDMVAKGRHQSKDLRGINHPRCRLTESQVHEIRRLASEGNMSKTAIAQQFGVSRSLVRDIVHRIRWAHLP